MDTLLIIGALLAGYYVWTNYVSPTTTSTTLINPLTGAVITGAPVTPTQIAGTIPATAGPTLPAASIPKFNPSTGQYITAGVQTPSSFFQSGPTGNGLTPPPEWNEGLGSNPAASGWLYADGSMYFESGPAAGQATGTPASAWGGNSSMAALANGFPVSPNALMQTIAGA